MTSFLERWRGQVGSLATFGDSLTEALSMAEPAKRWANRLAGMLGATTLYNRGLSGTVLQSSPDASGSPRNDNGHSRYRRDLLGAERGDVVAILYGTNDARYTAAPACFGHAHFVRYHDVLSGLMAAGYAPEAIVIGSPGHLPDAGFAVGPEDGFAVQSSAEYQRYTGTIKSIAREFGTFYAPVPERMSAEGGDSLILPDHVHPNTAGHAKISEIFAAATLL